MMWACKRVLSFLLAGIIVVGVFSPVPPAQGGAGFRGVILGASPVYQKVRWGETVNLTVSVSSRVEQEVNCTIYFRLEAYPYSSHTPICYNLSSRQLLLDTASFYTLYFEWEVPPDIAPGIGIVLAEGVGVTESGESVNFLNSSVQIEIVAPDLVVSDLSIVLEKNIVSLTVEIMNMGGASAENVSVNIILDGNLVETYNLSFEPLQSHNEITEIELPRSSHRTEHLLEVLIDAENTVLESNESNNLADRVIIYSPGIPGVLFLVPVALIGASLTAFLYLRKKKQT